MSALQLCLHASLFHHAGALLPPEVTSCMPLIPANLLSKPPLPSPYLALCPGCSSPSTETAPPTWVEGGTHYRSW